MAHSTYIGMKETHQGLLLMWLLAVYLILHRMQFDTLGPAWIRFHGKAFLFIPVLLMSVQATCIQAGLPFKFTPGRVLVAFVYTVLVFEITLPLFRGAAWPDWADITAYALGAMAFIFLSGVPLQPLSVSYQKMKFRHPVRLIKYAKNTTTETTFLKNR